jgi:hypothetical protein
MYLLLIFAFILFFYLKIKNNSKNEIKVKKERSYEKEKTRQKIIRDFLVTESIYVYNLNILSEFYIEPLKEIMTKDDMKKIFPDIGMVFTTNNQFLSKMKDVIEYEKDKEKGFVKLFTDYSMAFKLYTGYISNYSIALEHLLIKQKDKIIQDFLNGVEKNLKEKGEKISDIHGYNYIFT